MKTMILRNFPPNLQRVVLLSWVLLVVSMTKSVHGINFSDPRFAPILHKELMTLAVSGVVGGDEELFGDEELSGEERKVPSHPNLYGCHVYSDTSNISTGNNNDYQGDDVKCCSCDRSTCHPRGDCCLDIDFKKNPDIPPRYFLSVVEQAKQFRNVDCVSVLPKQSGQKGCTMEHVVAVHRCGLDGNECRHENASSVVVVGTENNVVFVNEQCALCNNVTKFFYPDILISNCINESFIEHLLKNHTHFDLSELTNCRVTLKLPQKTVCPFGGISSRGDANISKVNCNEEDFQKCMSYFAAVATDNGYLFANPHCIRCLPFATKAWPVNCATIKEKFMEPPTIELSMSIRSFSSVGVFVGRQLSASPIRVPLCRASGVFDFEMGTCVYIETIDHSQEPSSLSLVLRKLVSIQKIVTVTFICVSVISVSWTVVTYTCFQELSHSSGKMLVNVCIVLFVYYVLVMFSLLRPESAAVHGNNTARKNKTQYVAILIHWNILTKHLLLVILAHYLRNLQFAETESYLRQRFYVVIRTTGAVILSTIAVVICASQGFVDYNRTTTGSSGFIFITTTVGRLCFYFAPILCLSMSSIIMLCLALRRVFWFKARVKKQFVDFLDILSSSYIATLKFVMFVLITDSLGCVYTGRNDENSVLLDHVFELLFLTLTALQGVCVFMCFIVNKHVTSVYKNKLATLLSTVNHCMKEIEDFQEATKQNSNLGTESGGALEPLHSHHKKNKSGRHDSPSMTINEQHGVQIPTDGNMTIFPLIRSSNV